MVKLNRIYTRTGDAGDTGLATGERVSKSSLRVTAYGEVDECNSALGVARGHAGVDPRLDELLERIQNELFDLGADLAVPESPDLGFEPLRIVQTQVDGAGARAGPAEHRAAAPDLLRPAGPERRWPPPCTWRAPSRAPGGAGRRGAGRGGDGESGGAALPEPPCRTLLFVAARHANGGDDVLWRPGATR